MAYFVTYSAASGSSTARPILRWGECPAASISAQASGESVAAMEVPTLGGLATASSATGWVINPTNGALSYIAAPYQPSPAEYAQAVYEDQTKIREALRACDWAVLADAPLTTAQQQAWITYRANLRALVNNGAYGQPAADFALPTAPTTTEF